MLKTNKTKSSNSYWLTGRGITALKNLIEQVRISNPEIPELSLDQKPLRTGLTAYIFNKIVYQIQQAKKQEAVSIRSWGYFSSFYYEKLTSKQKEKFKCDYPNILPLLNGNCAPDYLTNQNPHPQVKAIIPPNRQIEILMRKLDYGKDGQEAKFINAINSNNSTALAVSLSAYNSDLQDWLVYRLMKLLNSQNWSEINVVYSKVTTSWDLEYIQNQIAEKIPYLLESNDLISSFAKYVKGNFVVIKVKNTEAAHHESLMNDFWHPLCNHLNIISNSENPHMRLLMFIVNSLEVEMDSYDICCLKPELKIDYGDVKDWFEIKEVKSYMECARGITNHKNFVKKEAPNLNYENLPKLLGTLASYANPQVDFNDIKKCWIIGE